VPQDASKDDAVINVMNFEFDKTGAQHCFEKYIFFQKKSTTNIPKTDLCVQECDICIHKTATHGKTLQHTAKYCNTWPNTATHGKILQHIATHCNTLHHTAPHGSQLATQVA